MREASSHARPATRLLILASESPRRAALLREYGFEFDIIPPPLCEPPTLAGNPPPSQLAEALSYYKANSVAPAVSEGLILAADTVVALYGQVFGKPIDRGEARHILRALAGSTHEVITGVTVIDAATRHRMVDHDVTRVTMRTLTVAETDAYLASGEWAGKAGAYGIQDVGDRFITDIVGSFTNVVGLPMELVTRMLKRFQLTPGSSSPSE